MSVKITENDVYLKCVGIIQDSFKLQVKYHVFAMKFQSLSSDMKAKIVSTYESFVDSLSSVCFQCLSKDDSSEFLFKLHNAIKDKIVIGLTAVDRMKIEDIEEKLMHTCGFISISSLKYIVEEFDEFEMSVDNYVRLVHTPPKKRSELHDTNGNNVSHCKEGGDVNIRQKQLKYLYRCHPEIIQVLHPDLTWRKVLDAYSFWEMYCKLSSSSLVDWLLEIAKVKDVGSYSLYEKKMKEIIGLTVMSHVQDTPFTIKNLSDVMSDRLPKVITHEFLHKVILGFPSLLRVENESGSSTCASFTVRAITSYSSMKEYFKPIPISSFSKRKVEIVPIDHFAFIPPAYLPKLMDIANTNCSFDSICHVFAKVEKDVGFFFKIVRKFDSFLHFLVEFVKERKQCDGYEKHIQGHVVRLLKDYAKLKGKIKFTFDDAYQVVGQTRLINEGFLIKCLYNHPEDFVVHTQGFTFLGKLHEQEEPKYPSLERKKTKARPSTSKTPFKSSQNSTSVDDDSKFVKKMCNVLTQKIQLRDVSRIIDTMQGSLRRNILQKYNSLYHFISFRLPPYVSLLDKLIFREIVNWLGSRITTFEKLKVDVFFGNLDFLSSHEIINFLLSYRETFLLTQEPNVFLARRRVDANGNTLFYNEYEKITLRKIVRCYPRDRNGIGFLEFYALAWQLNLTEKQRLFVFGTRSGSVLDDILDGYFKIYVCMYPLVFSFEDQNVFLVKQEACAPIVLSESENVIVISDTEEGEIVEQSQQRKRKGSSSIEDEAHKKRKSVSPVKEIILSPIKNRRNTHSPRKRQSSTPKRTVPDTKESDPKHETPETFFSDIPSHLTHDSAVAKLLETTDNTMTVHALCDYLMVRILTKEQRHKIAQDRKLFNGYQENVLAVLRQGETFNLASKDGSPMSVTLVIKSPAPKHTSPTACRSLNALTGVSNEDLLSFVKDACFVSKKSIPILIMFAMAWKKFKASKPNEETPDAILQTQLIGCLKDDDRFVMDVVEGTCFPSEYIPDFNKENSYQCTLKKFGKNKLIGNLISLLKDQENGISLQDLCVRLCKDISDFPLTTMRVLVQGVLADSTNQLFGFLQGGQITKLRDQIPITMESDSESELTIDEEKCCPIAGSFDKSTTDNSPDIESMCNKYIEADVIRLDNDPPRKRSADTTQNPLKLVAGSPDADKLPRRCSKEGVEGISTDPNSSAGCISSGIVSSTVNVIPKLLKQNSLSDNGQDSKVNAKKPRVSNSQRETMLKMFLTEYLSTHNNSANTEEVVKAAYSRYENERFANSVLAFEAYVCDYVVSSDGLFSFGTRYGGIGVTWLFYRPSSGSYNPSDQMEFMELLPKIPIICKDFLLKQPNYGDMLENISRFVSEKYYNKFCSFPNSEIQYVCRALILIGAIRTLQWFVFAKSKSYLSLRREVSHNLNEKEPTNQKVPLAVSHHINLNHLDNHENVQQSNLHQQRQAKPVHKSLSNPLQKSIRDRLNRRSSLEIPHQPTLNNPSSGNTFNPQQYMSRSSIYQAIVPPDRTSTVPPVSQVTSDKIVQPGSNRKMSQDRVESNKGDKDNPVLIQQNSGQNSLDNSTKKNQPEDVANVTSPNSVPAKKSKSSEMRAKVLSLLSDIIHRNGPCTMSKLRDYWSNEADKDLRKVLASGVSFALSFRKFEKYFTKSSDGLVSVNDDLLNQFLQKNS